MGDAYDAMDAGRVPTKAEVERELARVGAELERERTWNRELRAAATDVIEKLGECDWSCEKLVFDQCGECPTCRLVIAAIALRARAALSTQEQESSEESVTRSDS